MTWVHVYMELYSKELCFNNIFWTSVFIVNFEMLKPYIPTGRSVQIVNKSTKARMVRPPSAFRACEPLKGISSCRAATTTWCFANRIWIQKRSIREQTNYFVWTQGKLMKVTTCNNQVLQHLKLIVMYIVGEWIDFNSRIFFETPTKSHRLPWFQWSP